MGPVETIASRLAAVHELPGTVRSARPPAPKSAKVELTSRCDLGCFFCASHRRPRLHADMEWALFTRLAHELRDAGVEQLGLFYIGESLLCDWLPEAVRYAKSECGYPYVFLTTNGVAASRERVEACILAGLDSLKFALNWAEARQFERITGSHGADYHDVLENVRAARSARDHVEHETGHRCSLYASSLRFDDAQPERMRETLLKIQACVDHHYWLPLFGHWGLPGPRLAGRPVPAKPLPCWALFTEAHVTRDGKLSACSLDASERFEVGDLTKTSFLEAWESTAFQALRRSHLAENVKDTACRHCLAY